MDFNYISKLDAHMLYQDIFVDECYAKHGITIKNGDVIVDVGANIGLFMLWVNSKIDIGTIYCYEPVSQIFSVLAENAKHRTHIKTVLFNLGLAQSVHNAMMDYYPRLPSISSRYDWHTNIGLDHAWFKYMPRFMRRWILKYYFKHKLVMCAFTILPDIEIDLLKIDAEQSEFDIFHGIRDWSKIKQIIVECHGKSELVHEYLEQKGFTVILDSNPQIPSILIAYGIRNHETQIG